MTWVRDEQSIWHRHSGQNESVAVAGGVGVTTVRVIAICTWTFTPTAPPRELPPLIAAHCPYCIFARGFDGVLEGVS